MANLLLGIDIGTSACKVALFNEAGEVVGAGSAGYSIYYPQPGWAEQNPEEWWDAVCSALKQMLSEQQIDAGQIAGIGIDGQCWSAIAIDRSGKVLSNTPIWIDTRAGEICEELKSKYGEEMFFELSGNPLQSFYVTGKILWYERYKPEVFQNTYKILQSNSFIAYRLTGVISQDISQSYGFHCFDMRKGCWDDEMRSKIGIPEGILPEIVPCHKVIGNVTKEAAALTGLKEGTPVVAGGLDAACGTLGAGVIHAGETQEQGGQAGGMSICLEEYAADPKLILSFHVVPNKWLLQGGTTGGGGVMRWFEKEFADYERMMEDSVGKSSLVQLNEIAEEVPAGSDGLVFLPYMAGERSPIWDERAKGVCYGMDFNKTKGHFVRAAMEGVAFSLRHNLDIAAQRGVHVGELRAMGGAANSHLWTQIKADVTGKTMVIPSSDTATTLGAAILAGVGTGVYESFEEAVATTVKVTRVQEPKEELYPVYNRNYQTYLDLYRNLKQVMNGTGGNDL